MAQAIRAILFASAMATLVGRRPNSAVSQGRCPVLVGALTAPTSMALTCRWRSRPQHHEWTLKPESEGLRLFIAMTLIFLAAAAIVDWQKHTALTALDGTSRSAASRKAASVDGRFRAKRDRLTVLIDRLDALSARSGFF
jgi:hypothetical protein